MKRVGILFDDRKLPALDLSKPVKVNPGIGGTEYCFSLLIYYSAECMENYLITVFHYNAKVEFSANAADVVLTEECWEKIGNRSIDILVFRAGWHENDGLIEFLDRNNIYGVAWAHNYLAYKVAKKLAVSSSVKRVIFVSQHMYEHYLDHDIIKKSGYIYNFVADGGKYRKNLEKIDPVVVYTGSLIAVKGFHLLAREWKKIVHAVPDAKLHVIGNGRLYFCDSKLGKWGVADEFYERRFIRYLTDRDGKLLKSVKFWGKLGEEKNKLYEKAAVGVINPSGKSETFGLSAVEMEMQGVPVVTYKRASYPEIIEDKKTGYLCRSRKEFRYRIIQLLQKSVKSYNMGLAAQDYAWEKFNIDNTIREWEKVFEQDNKKRKGYSYESDGCNKLKDINRKIRNRYSWMPSLIWVDIVKDWTLTIKELFMRYIVLLFRY